jgi:Xaa-Pro dipeptidase
MRQILIALQTLGVIVSDANIDDALDADLGAVFMPHGLGHLIGCDTHDVGGYLQPSPERPTRPGIKNLRTARLLEEGMVLTNEPGCYFIDPLIDDALQNPNQSKYINSDQVDKYRGRGGVRLEDVFVITSDGCINLTTCPRTVEEVDLVLSGGQWPPKEDKCPSLKRQWCSLNDDCSQMVNIKLV